MGFDRYGNEPSRLDTLSMTRFFKLESLQSLCFSFSLLILLSVLVLPVGELLFIALYSVLAALPVVGVSAFLGSHIVVLFIVFAEVDFRSSRIHDSGYAFLNDIGLLILISLGFRPAQLFLSGFFDISLLRRFLLLLLRLALLLRLLLFLLLRLLLLLLLLLRLLFLNRFLLSLLFLLYSLLLLCGLCLLLSLILGSLLFFLGFLLRLVLRENVVRKVRIQVRDLTLQRYCVEEEIQLILRQYCRVLPRLSFKRFQHCDDILVLECHILSQISEFVLNDHLILPVGSLFL